MNDLKTTLNKELAELEQLRDEFRVKAHLAKADAKDAVAKLEQKWPELRRELQELERRSSQAVEGAGKDILSAARTMRDEYKRLLRD